MSLVCKILILLSALGAAQSSQLYCNGTGDSKVIAGFFSGCSGVRDGSNCPAEKWLELFKDSDMQGGSKTGYKIINVGFNKGYNFAEWLNVFAPSSKIDIRTWYSALESIPGLTMGCGACGDCRTPPVVSPHMGQPNPHIHIVGVDLNKANIFTVNAVVAQLNKTHDLSQLKLELVHAAGGMPSTEPGASNSLKIPVCPNGNELCKIPDDPSKLDANQQYEDVPLISMDGLVHSMHLLKSPHGEAGAEGGAHHNEHNKHHDHHDVIDILHIDTEGNDAQVIKSATQLLKSHKVRALIFEYHEFLPWGHTKLSDVTESINKQGMECFMCGQDRLWPITGDCWDEKYEFHQWSNVLCLLRTDPWLRAVEPLIQTMNRIRARYPLTDGALLNINGMRDIFAIKDGKRHGFSNWDAFVNRGYSSNNVQHFHAGCSILDLFPEGDLFT